jgi:hypothetical protein
MEDAKISTAYTVVNVPWTRHKPVIVNVGARVRVERDPFDEPLPIEGTVTGVRIHQRQRIDIGQEPFYVIVLVEESGTCAAREFDLEEITITCI